MKRFVKCLNAFLSLVIVFTVAFLATTSNVFADEASTFGNWKPGQTVNATEGDPYTSVTGHKYGLKKFSFMKYKPDGSKEIVTSTQSEGYTDKKFYVGDTFAYCIESGRPFKGGDYVSSDVDLSDYMKLLDTHVPAARNGIMLAMLYGYNQSSSLPSTGQIECKFNADDFAYATQIIIWEYQSGIRTSPTEIKDLSYRGYTIKADNYVQWIEGQPAKNCYNWILKQMSQHWVYPSFAGASSGEAKIQVMKYNPSSGKYSVTLRDTNNTLCDLIFPATSGITVTRNGNQYTFSTSQTINSPVTLTAKKKVPSDTGNFLIWSNGKDQTLATGVSNPVQFFVKLQTEAVGEVKVAKQTTDHTGEVIKLSGAAFDLMVKDGDGWSKATTLVESKTGEYTLPTNAQGYYSYNLQIGKTYKIVETSAPTGVVNTGWESEEFTYSNAGAKYTYTCSNEIPTGEIRVVKTDSMVGFTLKGAVFEITAAEDITYSLNGTTYTRYHKGDVVGEMTTDAEGVASLGGLYYGTYVVTETKAPDGYHILIPSFTATVKSPEDYKPTTIYPSASIGVTSYDVESTVNGEAQVENRPKLAQLTVHKTGQGNQDLSGIKLQLFDSEGKVVQWKLQEDGTYAAMLPQDGTWIPADETDTLITSDNGRVELVNIPYGTYTLREIQTEAGYQLLPNPVTITLPYELSGEKDTSGGEVYYSGNTNFYYHLTYDLRNTLVYRLPATGGYVTWIIGIGVAMVALGITIIVYCTKRKRNEGENKE